MKDHCKVLSSAEVAAFVRHRKLRNLNNKPLWEYVYNVNAVSKLNMQGTRVR